MNKSSVSVSVQPSCTIACITSVHTLKVPNTGSQISVWRHENTAHNNNNNNNVNNNNNEYLGLVLVRRSKRLHVFYKCIVLQVCDLIFITVL